MYVSNDDGRQFGLAVFAATKARDRDLLGERVTDWIRTHPKCEVVDKLVLQSSDSEFHCLTIVLAYRFDANTGR
jgi:hypothetical protein